MAGEGGLFPPRDAWVYEEIGYVEAAFGNHTTPNPPFGSTLNYYLRDGLPEGEENRIVLSIESADGATVRLLSGPTTAGAHRVQWDLRQTPEEAEQDQPRRRRRGNRRRGTLVAPGQYTVRLLQVVDGEQRLLGEPRSIKVQALRGT